MEITFFTPRFYPAISGGEFYILNLALGMKGAYKDNVRILCSDSIDFKGLTDPKGLIIKKNHPEYNSYMNIPIHRLNPIYNSIQNSLNFNAEEEKFSHLCEKSDIRLDSNILRKFLSNGPNFNRFFSEISNQKNILKCDLVHSTFLPYTNIIYSLILARQLKVPSVCTPFYHIYNPRYDNIGYVDVLKFYDGVIACTEVEKHFFMEHKILSEKIRVIPMGVDLNLYKNPVKSQSGKLKSFKSEFKISSPFVLFCGYKNYEKGAINLLQSAIELNKYHNSIEYVFIGPSTQAFDIELKKARKNGVKILNLTPQSMTGYFDWRKISAFQECSLFAMPSRSDAYGMVYLEAWASSKPVIGARTSVMEEVISDGKDGLLIDFGNTQTLVNAIHTLIIDPDLAEKMGRTGLEKVTRNNSWAKITRETKTFYKSILEDNKK